MSLDFSIIISTELKLNQLKTLLSKASFLTNIDENYFATGIKATLINTNLIGHQLYKDIYGLNFDLLLQIRITPKDLYQQAKSSILKIVKYLYDNVNGKFVLIFNGDVVVIEYLEDKIILDSNFAAWTESELNLITNFKLELIEQKLL